MKEESDQAGTYNSVKGFMRLSWFSLLIGFVISGNALFLGVRCQREPSYEVSFQPVLQRTVCGSFGVHRNGGGLCPLNDVRPALDQSQTVRRSKKSGGFT